MANRVQFIARKGLFIALGHKLVEFCDGNFSTSDPRTINDLRKHPGYGRYFREVKTAKSKK